MAYIGFILWFKRRSQPASQPAGKNCAARRGAVLFSLRHVRRRNHTCASLYITCTLRLTMMTSTCVRDDGGFSGGHVYGNLGTLDEVDAPSARPVSV